MKVRLAQLSDIDQLRTLFCDTVQQINCRDYSPKQVEIWSSAVADENLWRSRLQSSEVYVVESVVEAAPQLMGFASLKDGDIDLFFCHSHYQDKGVGTRLLNHLEQVARSRGIDRLHSEVSITAKSFFERRGFRVVQPQWVERQGVLFRNFVMEKNLKG
jgi:putative acetyltransferase